MWKFRRGLLFISMILVVVACGSRADAAECKNLIVHINDWHNAPDFASSDFSGDGTAVFLCNGSDMEIRDQVSIHMISGYRDALCYSDFACGNLDLWMGSFQVGAHTMNVSFLEFLRSGVWQYWGVNTPSVSVKAQFDYFEIKRNCSRLGEKICVKNR